jgi:tetratricopeptide (TPR) repeat protein
LGLLGGALGLSLALGGCAGTGESHVDGHDHARTQVPRRVVPEGAGAPLFNDLGDYGRPVTTSSELAQRYFDQGLILSYGFNHAEAHRSFAEASKQDPGCAICAWGEAYVFGPNINKPMDDADVPAAWEATQRALAARDGASPVERDLIDALAKRYAAEPVVDRTELDLAYAEAMRTVAAKYPDDLDVQTLFAEAVMDTMPWDYYVDSATPRPATLEVFAALESVMERNPEHPGALHLYIHAVEPSTTPGRGEAAADQLGALAPGAGHLVHMPSHIYLRIGRYHAASSANEKAAAADESYITQCRAQGFYPAVYYPHNVHFLYASSAFEGRSAVSIAAARKLSANMTPEIVAEVPIVEEFVPMELFALARFGRWSELAATDAPPSEWRYTTGVWHYVRGMAAAAGGDASTARSELDALRSIAAELALSEMVFASGSTPVQLLDIGALVLEARIAGEAGRWNDTVPLLEKAVSLQDALPYTEPPPWYFPTREALGHALVQAKRPADAEAIFVTQLGYTPRNGWSLRGLADSQRAQGKSDAAAETERQLEEVWQRADIEINTPTL